jgi:hypothetical protein
MTDEHHTGGSAYPHDAEWHEGREVWAAEKGMTLRDWFAGQAIMGFCADPTNHDVFASQDEAAMNAYTVADAMIAARNKPPSP